MAHGDERRERRHATALFIDITGFTSLSERSDPEVVGRVVRGLLARFKRIVEHWGGTVNQTQGDAVFAVFGIPMAIEHAARAAVNAAIDMHNDTEAYSRERDIDPPLVVHTGIYTGVIVVVPGLVQQIDVNSPTVNRAARLKDKAPPGGIWIGEETWRAVRDDFEFRDLGSMEFKNVEVPLRVHEVISRTPCRRSDDRRDLPFVGRGRERARLAASLAELALGEGGVVSVVGDAGLGKSRLAAELEASDAAQGVRWLEGRSQQFGSNLSFHAFADLLRSWAGIGEHESGAPVLTQLEKAAAQLFDGGGEDVVPFLATLIGVEPGAAGRERLAGITGEAMDRLVHHAMRQFLGRLAERGPLVLVFEDLHSADVSSLDLLARLLRLAVERPILFLLLMRPDPSRARERVAASVAAAPGLRHEEIAVQPLDRETADNLIDRIFAGGDVPNATRRLIEERTEGNPFYVGEVVQELVEQGALERRGDALFATTKETVDSIAISANVHDVIAARVDRRSETARRVLHAAAILGRNADRRMLEAILERADLDSDLAELDRAQLLVARERAGETIHRFAHPLIAEVVYEGISIYERSELHVRVARAIEETLAPSGAGYHAMLAYHWTRAAAGMEAVDRRAEGERERAVREFSLACEAGGATSEALDFLEEAAPVLLEVRGGERDSRTDVLIHRKLALAYLSRGKMREGNAHLDDALVLLGQRRRGTSKARRAVRFGWAGVRILLDLYLRGERGRRRPATEQDREVIDLMVASAQAQVTTDPEGFRFDSMDGLYRLSRVDPASVDGAGSIYAAAAGFVAYAGLSVGAGERLLRRARRFVNEDDARERFAHRVFEFVHRFLAGDWDERFAIEPELVEENVRLSERLGEFWHVINYLPLDAKRRAHQGRFDEAGELLERIGKIGDLYDYDLARPNEHAVRMFLELERGRLPEALAAADAYFEGFDEELFNLLALGTKAKVELMLGRRTAAEATLARASEIERRTRVVPPFQASGLRAAELRLALARLDEAAAGGARPSLRSRCGLRRAAARAVASARKAAWQLPEALRLSGHCAWVLGRPRAALRAWGEAIDAAEQLGMRPELGRTWLEIGRRLGSGPNGSGPDAPRFRDLDAAACFARAEEIFRELGLDADPV